MGVAGNDRALVSSTTSKLTRTFAAGTLIIPLDTTFQDDGALRAYGLVYQLLRNNVSVQWAIRAGKPDGGDDVTISAPATVGDLETGAAITLPRNYSGGPFVIDAAERAAALPIVNAWLASDTVTVVHSVTAGTFTADIARTLTAAPRIAVFQDGYEDIAISNFNAAGITDSTGSAWTTDSIDVLPVNDDTRAGGIIVKGIRGPTETNHHDGALWNADGTPRYCSLSSMHYDPTNTPTGPADVVEVVAEVRDWLHASPGNHAFMQCLAIQTFENIGHFLTKGGILDDDGNSGSAPAPSPLTIVPDDPMTQIAGALEADIGYVHSMGLLDDPNGSPSPFLPGVRPLIQQTDMSTPSRIVLLSGQLDGDSANGKVSYLAGHDYREGFPPPVPVPPPLLPLSNNHLTNGVKVMLNSVFESGCATATGGQPVVTLTKTAPAVASGKQITYTLSYANTGTGVANDVTITDQLPAGSTFVSAGNGGTHAAGTVTWMIGNLAPGASGSVTLTVGATADGTYTNQADIHFKIGVTPKTVPSNAVMTRVGSGVTDPGDPGDPGNDADHDGVLDGLDNCPAVANPDQADQDDDGIGDACDPDKDGNGFVDNLGVSGGGCNTGGGGLGAGAIAMLALLTRRRRGARLAALALCAGAALPRLAAAQAMEPANFGVERFRLSSDRDGMFDVEGAEVRGNMAVDAALWAGLANDPLVVYQGQPGDRAGSLIANRAGGSLSASISPRRWLQVGLDLPLVVYQDRPSSSVIAPMGLESLHSFGTSNLRVIPKFVVLHQADHGVSLAVIPAVILPTRSTSNAYFDDRGFGFAPELALSKRWTGWRAGLDAGYRVRHRAVFLNQVVDDELFAHAGVGYQFADRGGPPVGVDVTMSGATAARAPMQTFNENHLETLVGATYDFTRGAQLFGAAGAGLRKGYGTPDWRGLAGLRIGFGGTSTPSRPRELDRDGDGIVDTADKCPDQAEDKDGFEDSDGCPDPDNDKDGVLDAEDRCMNVPGLADLRGCPDSDGDGIADLDDKCPTEAEDKDGFEDGDGCPELDNDKDGTPDVADACPLDPGPAENQGCPDADRDGDTVVDRLDNCPDEKGLPENQGCPKKQLVKITDDKLEIIESVYFKTDRAVIEPRSFALLDNVAAVLTAHDKLAIQVEGHTDSQGDDAYNKKLSQRRAEAVVAYLVKKAIDKARLTAMGFGEEKPIADNRTAEGRAQNRRVVFTILSGGDNVKTHVQGASDDTK